MIEDYSKCLVNSKHEIILIRNREDTNVYTCPRDIVDFTITKLQWRVPTIHLSDHAQLTMLRYLQKERDIPVFYRSWELCILPNITASTTHSWNVKTTKALSRPNYIFVAFQTDRAFNVTREASYFDHCNVTNMKVFLNSQYFPYEDLNTDFATSNYHEVARMIDSIQQNYYNHTETYNSSRNDYASLLQKTVFAFDCTRMNEFKSGSVDLRIEFSTSQQVAPNTTAYCLIIHDNFITYSPFHGTVNREI